VGNDLALRVISALVLAPVALATAYFGGWPFLIFWTIAAVGTWWEWNNLVGAREVWTIFPTGVIGLVAASVLLGGGRPGVAVAAALAGTFAAAVLARRRRAWTAGGALYAAVLVFAPVILRNDQTFGFTIILLLFAVVWATDIAGYFAGRMIGGPKLWPRVSPKKTWSGALAGTAAAVLAGLAVSWFADVGSGVAGLCLVLSVASQAGDLFESAAKRRFGAKDASTLIPGHGGLMDRLDGFVAAAAVAVLVGIGRGGIEAPSRALLIW
jgi:phosphatidate cytidylyltransferase